MNSRVIVIGAGAAGLTAAASAAKTGATVTLLEKMQIPGRKLAITGKGRCNLTNSAPIREFIAHFGKNGKFLYQAFSRFFTQDLLELFHGLGIETVTERGGRIFPVSEQAQDIVDALMKWNRSLQVDLQTGSSATSLVIRDKHVRGVNSITVRNGIESMMMHRGDAVIIATGGVSYPGTGSTGDGYRLAQSAGHTVIPARPALVPLITEGNTARRLQGLTLKNVNITLWSGQQKIGEAFGEMLFTHFGLSGPVILTLSHKAVKALESGLPLTVSIDLKPALGTDKLDARLIRELNTRGKQYFHNLLKSLLPLSMIPVCIDAVGIPAEKPAHQITGEERNRLLCWLKDFRLAVTGHRPLSEAIVTAGGVSLKEIDPRTMASRVAGGLYFAGEVMDLDADTGGYNLQSAFSTGWLAGLNAAASRL